MKELFNKNRSRTLLGLMVVLLLTVTCTCPVALPWGNRAPTPTPTPPPALGDYGDAPDGDQNMDTGYYAPTGGPWVMTYNNAGVAGSFPTMGEDPVPGPFMIDVDEFWIGPLFGASNLIDVPSIEDDADDPQDPDGVSNLQITTGRADCDKENGSHDPAGNNCMPVPAWSIPMNARLSIFFGYPPLGVWFTAVNASENMTYDGLVYWNLLVDLNQNGKWDGGEEWVMRDEVITLTPGEHETLISKAFKIPTSGRPWGRINFPFWVRSMVSSESVKDKVGTGNWDGRGTDDGFAIGEVEDYFVEWRPIGQILPNPPQPIQANACGPVGGETLEHLSTGRDLTEAAQLMPGAQVESVEVIGVGDAETGGVGTPLGKIEISPGTTIRVQIEGGVFDISITEDGMIDVVPQKLPEGDITIDFVARLRERIECSGSAPVEVTTAVDIPFRTATGETAVTIWGPYGISIVVIFDEAGHVTFVGMPGELIVDIFGGSISIEGPVPWVNVYGKYDEATGAVSAEGTGTVAGFPGIKVTFEGTLDASGVSGEYTMGADGGLPQGQPIVYQVDGTRLEESSGTAPTEAAGPPLLAPGVSETIQSFVDVFNTAFADGSVDHLYQLLHPSVIDLYGEEACRAYLGTIVETPTTLEYIDATRVGAWNFERDDAVIPVDFAYAVQANFTADGQTAQQELHLTLPGDESVRWFTDCGDPISEEGK